MHSFRTLLGDLATITRNRVVPQVSGAVPFEVLTRPTALQREVFMPLGVRLESAFVQEQDQHHHGACDVGR